MKTRILTLLSLILLSCTGEEVIRYDNPVYFPPNNNDFWETVSIESLGWNTSQLQPLLNFLEESNTKGFIILYNGRIAVESYMNGQSEDGAWFWASAGKTLTTAVVGIAEDDELLDLNSSVSTYLGNGWTSATLEQENLITVKNLLTMTSGLDDSIGDSTEPDDLIYLADAGTRWAYHNVYKKLQDVVAETSGQTWKSFFNQNLRDKIGMDGNWFQIDDFNVYLEYSKKYGAFWVVEFY
jgi:CubicO group peptidase (beta-lactamase class C family)